MGRISWWGSRSIGLPKRETAVVSATAMVTALMFLPAPVAAAKAVPIPKASLGTPVSGLTPSRAEGVQGLPDPAGVSFKANEDVMARGIVRDDGAFVGGGRCCGCRVDTRTGCVCGCDAGVGAGSRSCGLRFGYRSGEREGRCGLGRAVFGVGIGAAAIRSRPRRGSTV